MKGHSQLCLCINSEHLRIVYTIRIKKRNVNMVHKTGTWDGDHQEP